MHQTGGKLFMDDSKFINRRKHIRIPMVNVIKIRLNGTDPLPALLVDLSVGGARVMCQFPLAVSDEVGLTIPLFGEKSVDIYGEIVWIKETEMMKDYNFGVEYMAGIQFNESSKDIQEFVEWFTNR
jgi:c-di-GMP-binding flagellar brake protein YcgR